MGSTDWSFFTCQYIGLGWCLASSVLGVCVLQNFSIEPRGRHWDMNRCQFRLPICLVHTQATDIPKPKRIELWALSTIWPCNREEQLLMVMQEMQTSAAAIPGIVSCLVQGVGDQQTKPKILHTYLSEKQLIQHWEGVLTKKYLQDLVQMAAGISLGLHGDVSANTRLVLWKATGGLQLQTEWNCSAEWLAS